MPRKPATETQPAPRHGVARVLSKQGLCSRTQAAAWVAAGRVAVNGRVVRACLATVPAARSGSLRVELAIDPYW